MSERLAKDGRHVGRRVANTPIPKLDAAVVEAIRSFYPRDSVRTLAESFGVTEGRIRQIVHDIRKSRDVASDSKETT